MIVFRLARAQFKNDLSGKGAYLAGGRWNSIGIPAVYTAESRALATLEIAVHSSLNVVPDDYFLIEIEIPDDAAIRVIKETDLPHNWKSFPETQYTQIIGDNFFKTSKELVLKVPSAIVEGDYNILINPLHKEFIKVTVKSTKKFEFDQRLFLKSAEA